jgi:hypothetical protein
LFTGFAYDVRRTRRLPKRATLSCRVMSRDGTRFTVVPMHELVNIRIGKLTMNDVEYNVYLVLIRCTLSMFV